MRLGRGFFERPCLEVARELVGTVIVRSLPGGTRLVGRLVEVEAYLGDGSDPASHCHRGPTPRNASMFGPPGRIYAYRSYGIHTCVNLVCEPKGSGAGVLLRSLEPLEGLETMRSHRRLRPDQPDRLIASGPGRLAQALGIDLSLDGASALSGPISLRGRPSREPAPAIGRSRRVGVGRGATLPYRFFERGSPWLGPGPR